MPEVGGRGPLGLSWPIDRISSLEVCMYVSGFVFTVCVCVCVCVKPHGFAAVGTHSSHPVALVPSVLLIHLSYVILILILKILSVYFVSTFTMFTTSVCSVLKYKENLHLTFFKDAI